MDLFFIPTKLFRLSLPGLHRSSWSSLISRLTRVAPFWIPFNVEQMIQKCNPASNKSNCINTHKPSSVQLQRAIMNSPEPLLRSILPVHLGHASKRFFFVCTFSTYSNAKKIGHFRIIRAISFFLRLQSTFYHKIWLAQKWIVMIFSTSIYQAIHVLRGAHSQPNFSAILHLDSHKAANNVIWNAIMKKSRTEKSWNQSCNIFKYVIKNITKSIP